MATIETKIWQALKAQVATITGITLIYPNQEYSPSNEPYLEIMHLPNYSDRLTINHNGQAKYKGILQLILNYPVAKKYSYDVMQEQAGLIKNKFQENVMYGFQGINVQIEKEPDLMGSYRNEAYWKFPISIRYICFN